MNVDLHKVKNARIGFVILSCSFNCPVSLAPTLINELLNDHKCIFLFPFKVKGAVRPLALQICKNGHRSEDQRHSSISHAPSKIKLSTLALTIE